MVWSYKIVCDIMMGFFFNRDFINSIGFDELFYLNFIYYELGYDVIIFVLNILDLYIYFYVIDVVRDDMFYFIIYDGYYVGFIMIYEGFVDVWVDYVISYVNYNYIFFVMQMQKVWGEFWVEWFYNEIQSCVFDVKSGEFKNIFFCVFCVLEFFEKFVFFENVIKVYNFEVLVIFVRVFDKGWFGNRVVVIYGMVNLSLIESRNIKSFVDEVVEILRKFYRRNGGIDDVVVKVDVNVIFLDLSFYFVLIGIFLINRIVDIFDDYFLIWFERVGEGWRVICENNVISFFFFDEESFFRVVYGNIFVVVGGFQMVDKVVFLMVFVNLYNMYYYVVWIVGMDENMIKLFKNFIYYLSSYEIWMFGVIEVGFYNKFFVERFSELFNVIFLLSLQMIIMIIIIVRIDIVIVFEIIIMFVDFLIIIIFMILLFKS